MAYFQELNTSILFIENLLLADEELCQLLYYNNTTPLSSTPLSNTKILRGINLNPLPKLPTAETEKSSMVNYYFYSSKPWENYKFRKTYLCFDIICHLELWPIHNALRPYSILNRIDELFNEKYYNELSGKKVFFDDAKIQQYADLWYGYHLTYDVTNTSGMGGCQA